MKTGEIITGAGKLTATVVSKPAPDPRRRALLKALAAQLKAASTEDEAADALEAAIELAAN